MKTCTRCATERPLSDFAKGSKNKDGLQRWCNACRSERRAELACREVITEKRCKCCEETKPVSAFHRSNVTRDGYAPRCVACHKETYGVGSDGWKRRKKELYRVDTNYKKKLIQAAKGRALRDGVPFGLILDDITIPAVCPVLGIAFVVGEGGRAHGSPSLDRINPAKGYVPGNVRVISWLANWVKGSHTDPEIFEKVAAYIRRECSEK